MKTAIFYFSGTGNNLYVAREIAAGITAMNRDKTVTGDGTDNVEGDATVVLPVSELGKFGMNSVVLDASSDVSNDSGKNALENEAVFDIGEFDSIVFCAPSYYSHVPPFVLEMIGKVKFLPDQLIYSVVVCGGNRGNAIEDLRKAITCSGGTVTGEYMVMLPGNYILSYGAFPKWFCGVENSFARGKIKKIAKDVLTGSGHLLKSPGFFYKESDEARLRAAIDEFGKIGQSYQVAECCSGCGTCSKVCPVGNISMEAGKPVFSDRCQQCMACIQWCPGSAIDYEGKAAGKKRYHHSQVKVKDLMN